MNSTRKLPRRENPRVRANPISAALFLHMVPIFWNNLKKELKDEDLFDVLEDHKASLLGDTLEKEWKKQYKKHATYALHLALLKVHGFELVMAGILRLFNEISKIIVLPLSIGKLVSYFERGPPEVTESEAYLYASVLSVCILLESLITHPLMFWLMHISMKIRVACCSIIYRKSLRLNRTAMEQTTVGQIINLLSNDVRKFDEGLMICHYSITSPIQTAIGTYMLYQVIGISAFAGISFLLCFIPLQIYLGKLNSVVRLKTATRTDERVRLMNEILSGIQVIKMYTWEKPFAKLVAVARRYEIKATRVHYYIQSIVFSMEMFVARTSTFITIIIFVYLGNKITANSAFVVTAIYTVLRSGITLLFSLSLSTLGEMHISVLRLQAFLSFDELVPLENRHLEYNELQRTAASEAIKKQSLVMVPKISLKNVSAKWVSNVTDNNLTDINLVVEGSQLVAIIGPVGCGKSTLFNVILNELEVSSGCLNISGKVSYASQESWLFSASVRQNILFGDEYDDVRYQKVTKACALESDFKMLPYGDRTMVGEKGKSLSGGQKARINLARCIYKHADIYLLDDPLSAVDTKVGKDLYDNCIRKFLTDKICILITHQLQYLNNADKVVILNEGRIIGEGTFDELQHSGLDFAKLLQSFHGSDLEVLQAKSMKAKEDIDMVNDEDTEEFDNKEATASGSISFSTYATYFKAGGSVFVMFLVITVVVAAYAMILISDYFVSYWVNLEQDINIHPELANSTLSTASVIYTYSGITLGTIILALSNTVLILSFLMRASINMHNTIFSKISYATMRFFNSNPTGRILNRFSKDMGIIDEYIPAILFDVVSIFLTTAATMVLSAIVKPFLLLPFVVLLSLFHILRILYLRTSRSVKRIEAITRTPIFNHLTASMNGLVTIRAFNAQELLIKEFDSHQDLHSSAWYLYISASRAFGFYLDLLCAFLTAFVAFVPIVLHEGFYGGDVGLVVTQVLSLTGMLQWGVRQLTELENHMTSVERVLEYTNPETEPIRNPINNLPRLWPESGKIVFQNVSMRYNPNETYALKNLNFEILPQEKIGIVGRTGAGKTSTIAALFQLYDIEGAIMIDGVDTTKLPLEVLRSKISVIPQEPVLFAGTLRKNLDPFEEYSDKILWNALEQVELKNLIEDCPGGLTLTVSECGSNFSIGQRQLICLARAMIRNNRILILDEATANVDPYTDVLIQRTIRKGFANCTVLTVAHRLHTVMDSDKVLVMDHGEVSEYDQPHTLMQKPDSIFYSMVQATGPVVAQKLRLLAEENFKKFNPYNDANISED